jgi:hypothetical protein
MREPGFVVLDMEYTYERNALKAVAQSDRRLRLGLPRCVRRLRLGGLRSDARRWGGINLARFPGSGGPPMLQAVLRSEAG